MAPTPAMKPVVVPQVLSRREALRLQREGAYEMRPHSEFRACESGSFNISNAINIGLIGLLGAVIALVFGFIGARIVMSTAASNLPGYLESGHSLSNAIAEGSIDDGGAGDSFLHGISPIIAIVVVVAPLGAILAIGGIFAFAKFGKGKGRSST